MTGLKKMPRKKGNLMPVSNIIELQDEIKELQSEIEDVEDELTTLENTLYDRQQQLAKYSPEELQEAKQSRRDYERNLNRMVDNLGEIPKSIGDLDLSKFSGDFSKYIVKYLVIYYAIKKDKAAMIDAINRCVELGYSWITGYFQVEANCHLKKYDLDIEVGQALGFLAIK